MSFRFNLSRLFISLICLISFVGCGKKIQSSKNESVKSPTLEPVLAEEEKFLSRQQVLCEDGQICPESVVKIVSFENRMPRICTGFLAEKDLVITSASCLPKILRLKDQICTNDVFFFFPESKMGGAHRIGCEKVVATSDPQGDDPSLWRDDIAYLKMKTSVVDRAPLKIDQKGVANKENYHLWGIEQVDGEIGFIRKQNCFSVHNSFINPLASSSFSPNLLFSDCEFKDGLTGAPVLDDSGKVKAVLSGSIASRVKTYILSTGLLNESLRSISHATNMSCAQDFSHPEVSYDKECDKEISEKSLSDSRNKLLTDDSFVKDKLKSTQDFLDSSNIFLKFKVDVESANDIKTFVITPWCFKNLSNWIFRVNPSRGNYGFALELPQIKLKRVLNSYGEIGVENLTDASRDVFVEFSIKNLKKNQISDVYFWNDFGSPERFSSISTSCR